MNLNRTSRREWCQLGVAATAGLALLSNTQSQAQAQKQAAAGPGWIDAHVHVWTPDTTKYPLSKDFQRSDMQPPSFTPQELFAHSKPVGVSRIVLIQMSFYQYDNSYMLDMISKYPDVFSGVGIVDHQAPDLAQRMKDLAARGVRGFRLHARGDEARQWSENAGMARMWQIAAEEGLAVCPLINPSDLVHVEALCEKFPETTVVVDHFARIGVSGTVEQKELKMLCGLARFPKVHVKTSAFYALGKKQAPYRDLLPMIAQVRDAYGPQRLMWASDCPYQVQPPHAYEPSVALLRDAPASFLSGSDKQWLLRGTAEKVFFSGS